MRPPRRERTGTRRDGQVRRINTSEVRYPGMSTVLSAEEAEYRAWKESGRRLRPARDTGMAVESRLARDRRRKQRAQRRRGVSAAVAIVLVAAVLIGWRYTSDRRAAAQPLTGTQTAGAAPATGSKRIDAPDPSLASIRALSPKPKPTPVFAAYRGIELRLPVPLEKLTEVGFHQASYTYAVHLTTPLPDADAKAAKREKTTHRDLSTQSSDAEAPLTGSVLRLWRSRPGKPDSAVDVGAPAGTDVLAPVTGTVIKIKRYKLYGKYDDYELHIQPLGHPELDLVLIHVDDVGVVPGDKVVAGVTRLAAVRKLSDRVHHQLGDYTKGGGDHTHIQLNNARSPEYKGLEGAITVTATPESTATQ